MGTATALHLIAAAPDMKIAVVERDCTYKYASAPRSAGGIRQQFSLPANVQLSMYGIDFLKTGLAELCQGVDVDPDVQLRENGYLILAREAGVESLKKNVATQHACGATWIKLYDEPQLKARFPWLNTEEIVMGAFGEKNEGYFDPWALLQAMRKASVTKGVTYISQEVTGLTRGAGGRVEEIKLKDGSSIAASLVVNSAGPMSSNVMEMCGPGVAALPVKPRKRCMWLVKVGAEGSSEGWPNPPDDTPLTIDASGVYFRSESTGGRFVCGVAPPDFDPDSSYEDLENVREDLFEEYIWPAMYERAPAFESLKVENSWAGLYEFCTLDQNGIVGYHPDVPNMLLATGFSGHGLQMSPGVGRAISELVVDGKYQTIDLSIMSFDRVLKNEPVFEKGCY